MIKKNYLHIDGGREEENHSSHVLPNMQFKVQFEEKNAHSDGLLWRNCVQIVRSDKNDEKHESIECRSCHPRSD